MESITSTVGFYGRQCRSYLQYIFGFCHTSAKILTGANISDRTRGMIFVGTNAEYPYARGKRESKLVNDDEWRKENDIESVCGILTDVNFKQLLMCERFERSVLIV
jgi:hypothetical protein